MSFINLSANLNSFRDKARVSSLFANQIMNFEKNLQSNLHLVSVEEDINQEMEEKKLNVKKKKIQSYVKNRDTLYIEPPERVKKPIDISMNLIETKQTKKVIDLGIQSDEINYVEKTKPYLQQKIGKDTSTQIQDGDLFVYDRDVEPIITVVLGKLMEQVNLELNEEDEIKRIREAKANFTKRLLDEKQRVVKVEDEEIKKKRDNDNIKKLKKSEKNNKANSQRKIISRLFSKTYFKNLKVDVLSYLEQRGLFDMYLVESTKDIVRGILHESAEQYEVEDEDLDKLLDNVDQGILNSDTITHKGTIDKHIQDLYEEKFRQEEIIRLEEEEAKRKWEAKLERARLKKIKRLKDEIQKIILEQPVIKNEVFFDDISEIDNYEVDGGFIGVYGGLIACYLLSLINLKTNFFKQDSFYVIDSVFDMLSGFMLSSGKIIISINPIIEDELKKINSDIEIKTLNINTTLETKDWKDISNLLSNFNYCGDIFLRQLIIENNLDTTLYSIIIKAIVLMLEKGKENEKIQFVVNTPAPKLEDKLSLYRAYCILKIDNSLSSNDLLSTSDWIKDRKKKNIKIPEFNNISRVSKFYTPTPEYKILIYDKTAEFLIRNKVYENCLKAIVMRFDIVDMDTSPMFAKYNEFYDTILGQIDYSTKLQVLEYSNETASS